MHNPLHSTKKVDSPRALLQDALRVFVSLAFIGGSVYYLRDKWQHSFQLLKQINLLLFCIASGLFVITNLIVALRLQRVLAIQRIHISFLKVFYYCLVGLFFNLFLPTSLGGDVVKIYYLSKSSGAKLHTISSVIVDRVLGLIAVIMIAVIALPFFTRSFSDQKLTSIVLIIAVGFFGVVLLVFSRRLANRFKFLIKIIPFQKVRDKVSEFYQTILEFRRELPKLIFGIFLSLVVQVITIWMGFLIAQSIGINIPFMVFMLILPVTGIISMMPSLGGLGVREASVIYFLGRYSSPEAAGAFALAYDILIYGSGLFCGILFMLFDRKINANQTGY